jgi:hypothetical protein
MGTLGSGSESFPVLSHSVVGAEVVVVPLGVLVPADSPRVRGENAEHVLRLVGLAHDCAPIVVQRSTMRVVDGMHRLRALVLSGRDRIPVRFFDGSDEEAFELAVMMNLAPQGLPLSLADRRVAALRIMGWHGDWSDRAIAAVTGLSHKTVGAIRRRSSGQFPQSDSRLGRDGRIRPVDSTRIRRVVGDLIVAHPDASLRDIAKQAGTSPSTVRDVRNRLRHGDDPVVRDHPERPADQDCLDVATTLHRLRHDPALRFTESGRALLRLLDTCLITPARWNQLADAVPAHTARLVAGIARRCGRVWFDFATRVESTSNTRPSRSGTRSARTHRK